MTDRSQPSTLSRRAIILLSALAGLLTLLKAAGVLFQWAGMFKLLTAAVSECFVASAIVIAAGGYGHLALRRIVPSWAPRGLRAVTACLLGSWMLSMAMLVLGTAFRGLLSAWLWWPVVAAGIVLTALQGRRAMEDWNPPRRLGSRSLVWVILAAAAGLWLAGALRPPGLTLLFPADSYEVLGRRLEIPREFYDAQRIGPLNHNCYSYFPLGTEMLYLLAMCLRGGPYEGMYLATVLHGAMGALAVIAVFSVLGRSPPRRPHGADVPSGSPREPVDSQKCSAGPVTGNPAERDFHGLFSGAMLASTPALLYFSWLALADLTAVCCLTVALLWLRQWLADQSLRSALGIGVAMGAACTTDYWAAVIVAAPVLIVMIALTLIRRGRAAEPAAAIGLAMLLALPWLIRDAAYTHNPVFPFATETLGRGHWTAEESQRWDSAHALEFKPPVPIPPGWKAPAEITRAEAFLDRIRWALWVGWLPLLAAVGAVLAMIAQKGRPDPWNWALAGVLGLQMAAWFVLDRDPSPRAIVPGIVPAALLAGWVLARLMRLQANPFKKSAARPAHGPWGQGPAVVYFIIAVMVNLLTSYGIYSYATQGEPIPPLSGHEVVTRFVPLKYIGSLGSNPRILLIGDEARAFYFPSKTIYAGSYDRQILARWLEEGNTPEQVMRKLQDLGVTNLWINWSAIWVQAATDGFPSMLSAELWQRSQKLLPPTLGIIEALEKQGLTVARQITVKELLPQSATNPASRPSAASGPASAPAPKAPAKWSPPKFPQYWPVITIYAVPPAAGAAEL